MFKDLESIGAYLEEEMVLAICPFDDCRFEVVAMRKGQRWEDVFPLPFELQNAAGEAGVLLENRLAARLELEKFPNDFWDDEETVTYGRFLEVIVLGRSAQKYVRVFRAVSGELLKSVSDFGFSQLELTKVARWMRDSELFDHRDGTSVMSVLQAGVGTGKTASEKSTVFHLEMTSREDHRNRRVREGLVARKVEDGNGEFNERMYREVGQSWDWTDRLVWDRKQWEAYVARGSQHTWRLDLDGQEAGYFELEQQKGGSVEVVYFGLLPCMIGKGAGGAALSLVIDMAWELPETNRVWLHTCTEDHRHALANYEKRGFRIFKVEEE